MTKTPDYHAECGVCGDFELPMVQVTVYVNDNLTENGTISCRCPRCGVVVFKTIHVKRAGFLVYCGAQRMKLRKPKELDESRTGAPFNVDDEIDFHSLMEDDEKLAAILEDLARQI